MKVFTLIILFLIVIKTNSQIVQENLLEWKNYETLLDDSIKWNLINKISGNQFANINYLIEYEFISDEAKEKFISDELSSYHFIDYNNDDLLDIIYEGRMPKGIEKEVTVFFKNSGDSLNVALKILGKISSLNFEDDKIVTFTTIEKPCCCGFSTFKTKYSLENLNQGKLCEYSAFKNGYTEYFSNYQECYLLEKEAIGYFLQKESIVEHKEFVSKEDFYLTLKPEKISNTDNPGIADCTYTMNGNNQVGLFRKGSAGIIISTFKSIGNEDYYLVRINNSNNIQSIFKENDIFIYGWMKRN
jgi:hypothetical protein